LSEFDAIDHLPNRILMCGGGSSLSRLIDRLSTDDWYDDLPFTKRPSVHLVKPGDVVGIDDETGDVRDHTMITAMGLLRVGYDTMIGVTDDDSVRSKFDKMLRI
jgi:cell division protein FtsA